MIILRKTVPDDIHAIVDFGVEVLNIDPYEGLTISRVKVYSIATECVSSSSNFAWIAEEDGNIVGAVGALVHPMVFYEGNQASVVQFFCKAPRVGVKLLRILMEWIEGRRAIKMTCFTLEVRADPRIGKLLNRLGLDMELPVYMKIRS